jgi:hypothetical protein
MSKHAIADGTGAAVNVRVFNGPDLEALRTAIAEREIIQAVGRGRGVNPDATRPLNGSIQRPLRFGPRNRSGSSALKRCTMPPLE